MKRWVKPRTEVQVFEANEYVAACYSVVCDVNAANDIEKGWMIQTGPWWDPGVISNYDAGQTHSATACGALGNYYVKDNNGDGRFDSMIENSSDLGRLTCTIYTGDDYRTQASWSGIATGQTIYWTTVSGDRTWHHQGVVGTVDSSHPNRS